MPILRTGYIHHMNLFGMASVHSLFWVLCFFRDPCAKAGCKLCSVIGDRCLKRLNEKTLPTL